MGSAEAAAKKLKYPQAVEVVKQRVLLSPEMGSVTTVTAAVVEQPGAVVVDNEDPNQVP